MTFPRWRALMARWRLMPPPALQLARIASAIGIAPPRDQAPQTARELVSAAPALGLPVVEGRPDDPMLAFLDE